MVLEGAPMVTPSFFDSAPGSTGWIGGLSAQAVPVSHDHFPQQPVLSHREQAGILRGWIEERFDTPLPELMRREGIDMWIIITRE